MFLWRNKTRVILASHKVSEKMKEVILRIEDSAVEKFLDFIKLCQMVEVVNSNEVVETREMMDCCFYAAINELRRDKAFHTRGDYGYIMYALNDEVMKGFFFYSPREFITYLSDLGFDELPGKSTLYDTGMKFKGHYPDWEFLDDSDVKEVLRRKNIVVRFLSAFNRARRNLSERFSENRPNPGMVFGK